MEFFSVVNLQIHVFLHLLTHSSCCSVLPLHCITIFKVSPWGNFPWSDRLVPPATTSPVWQPPQALLHPHFMQHTVHWTAGWDVTVKEDLMRSSQNSSSVLHIYTSDLSCLSCTAVDKLNGQIPPVFSGFTSRQSHTSSGTTKHNPAPHTVRCHAE